MAAHMKCPKCKLVLVIQGTPDSRADRQYIVIDSSAGRFLRCTDCGHVGAVAEFDKD